MFVDGDEGAGGARADPLASLRRRRGDHRRRRRAGRPAGLAASRRTARSRRSSCCAVPSCRGSAERCRPPAGTRSGASSRESASGRSSIERPSSTPWCGWIRNDSDGVEIEIHGDLELIESFIIHVRTDAPALARVEEVSLIEQREEEVRLRELHDPDQRASPNTASTLISPDTFVCEDCLRELFDPADRRHRYPFINCTNCGPRYSIIRGVPYDRPLTTMAVVPALRGLRARVPRRRRPSLPRPAGRLLGLRSARPARRDRRRRSVQCDDPIAAAAALLRAGGILACKGIGGYHLMADPRNHDAVARAAPPQAPRREAVRADVADAAGGRALRARRRARGRAAGARCRGRSCS